MISSLPLLLVLEVPRDSTADSDCLLLLGLDSPAGKDLHLQPAAGWC
jgi:hypothetical protein